MFGILGDGALPSSMIVTFASSFQDLLDFQPKGLWSLTTTLPAFGKKGISCKRDVPQNADENQNGCTVKIQNTQRLNLSLILIFHFTVESFKVSKS